MEKNYSTAFRIPQNNMQGRGQNDRSEQKASNNLYAKGDRRQFVKQEFRGGKQHMPYDNRVILHSRGIGYLFL